MMRTLAAAGLAALALGACGGDDDDGPRLAEPVETSTTAKASETTEETTTTTEAARTDFVVGDRVETAAGNFITVYSYEQPAPNPEYVTPEEGTEFAVMDVELCLGTTPEQPISVGPGDFELVMPDNTRAPMAFYSVREPALNYVELSMEGDCVRGWVAFQPPVGVRPTRIAALYTDPQVRWSVR